MSKPIFFVAITSGADKVKEMIKSIVDEGDVFELDADKIFVAWDGGISRDLAEKIGIRRPGGEMVGSGLVMPVDSYSGRAKTALWEWLKLKRG